MTELDTLTREIKDFQKDIISNGWKIGERLKEIKIKQLFLEKYQYFEDYLAQEVKLGRSTAYMYMQFYSEIPDVQRVGHDLSLRRVSVLLTLEPEKREEVLDKVRDIQEEKGKVTDADFHEAVNNVKHTFKDSKWKSFFEIEDRQKALLSAVEDLAEDLKFYKPKFDRVSKTEDFKKYMKKKQLIAKHHQIMKELSNL